MKMINKLRSILEERRLWKEYIVTNRIAEYLGKLTGTRPYFMSFDENTRKVVCTTK